MNQLVSLKDAYGEIEVSFEGDFAVVRGAGLPEATIDIRRPWGINMATIRRGVGGCVGSDEVRIIRPRFALRRRDRHVHVDGGGLELRTEYRRSRRWSLVRRRDGSVVYQRDRSEQFVDESALPREVSIALALEAAGVFETHSLVNYLTL